MSGLLLWWFLPMVTLPCCPGPVVKQPIVEGGCEGVQPIVEGVCEGVQLFTAGKKGL